MSAEVTGRPMEGVKVLEVAMFAFVPSGAVILADWGAQVIKVEHPVKGDPQRNIFAWGVPGDIDGLVHLFEVTNRKKRAIGIDIATEEGHAILMRLVDQADVFVTNFLPPARRKLRIEPEDIHARNPRVVYARGSAQGPRGDAADRGGFDSVSYWGKSGAALGVTPPDAEWPLAMPGPGFGDLQSGMALAGGIAAGLYQRERTGRGTVVDVSLTSVGVWAMGMTISGASVLGTDVLPHQYHHESTNPVVNIYRTSDGHLLSLGFLQSDRYWPEFAVLLERTDLLADPRFSDAQSREANSGACIEILEQLFAERTLAEWKAVLSRQDGQWDVLLPAGQVENDPQVRANGYAQRVAHPSGREIVLVPAPVQFDGVVPDVGRAPTLGADTDDVLAEIGLDPEDVVRLRDADIVR